MKLTHDLETLTSFKRRSRECLEGVVIDVEGDVV